MPPLLKALVRLGISAALLYFVLRSIDLPAFWERVKGMNPASMVLALAAYAFTQSIAVWRWNRLLRAQHIDVERRRLTESIWVSLFFNNFLPSNIGGDVVRIADTAPAAGSKTLAMTVILMDRVLGLTALVIIASSGALVASLAGVHIPGARWLWLVSALGTVAAISVIAMPHLVGNAVGHALMPLRALNRPWLSERAQRLEDAVIRFRNAPSAVAGAFAGAMVVQITIVAFYLLTAKGLSVPLPIFLGAVLIPVSLVVQMAPVSINGFGVREAVFAFFFRRFGLPTDAAVALSLVSTGMVMGLSLVGGLFFLRRR
ncbi:MAG: flippase-like domain-containing protein [Cyanobacteria bacterium]|nr:flippase-like domain-containing protein [Cyanobacteriota bacterium]